MKGSELVKWPESTITLDRQGAVAVYEARCQQSLDLFGEIKRFSEVREIVRNLRELATDSGLGQRASSKEKLGKGKGT